MLKPQTSSTCFQCGAISANTTQHGVSYAHTFNFKFDNRNVALQKLGSSAPSSDKARIWKAGHPAAAASRRLQQRAVLFFPGSSCNLVSLHTKYKLIFLTYSLNERARVHRRRRLESTLVFRQVTQNRRRSSSILRFLCAFLQQSSECVSEILDSNFYSDVPGQIRKGLQQLLIETASYIPE